MVSPEIESIKKDFLYVHLVLQANSPVYLLVPYIYPKNSKNTLQEWILVNNNLKESRFTIPKFEEIKK